jgi:hypothetical protein
VKKQWLVIATVAVFGLLANSFADVQNIRLSGDIRIRGYYLSNRAGVDTAADGIPDAQKDNDNDSFIAQRTRVCVEADLEDHVLVVVTLKAEGEWGASDESASTAGAGTAAGSKVNRRWDLGVTEAYVQLNELFYTPATLKLGRQYLNYGRGLIISSVEQEYNYDAARLVLDYYPFTLDAVYAKAIENTPFGPGTGSRDADLVFLNGKFEMTDSAIKALEVYFGWLANSQGSTGTAVPPGIAGDSPLIVGARMEVNPADSLNLWFEGAYEFDSDVVSAFLLNAGGKFSLKDAAWSPSFNFNYIYASGGGPGGKSVFRPWFDYVDGYNGYVFSPALSNLHIFNVGATVKPYENTSLSLQGYYYYKADQDGFVFSNVNADNGGVGYVALGNNPVIGTFGNSREIGWELDGILGYDYSKDVRMQLVYGVFIPQNAWKNQHVDNAAHELRAEVNVRF